MDALLGWVAPPPWLSDAAPRLLVLCGRFPAQRPGFILRARAARLVALQAEMAAAGFRSVGGGESDDAADATADDAAAAVAGWRDGRGCRAALPAGAAAVAAHVVLVAATFVALQHVLRWAALLPSTGGVAGWYLLTVAVALALRAAVVEPALLGARLVAALVVWPALAPTLGWLPCLSRAARAAHDPLATGVAGALTAHLLHVAVPGAAAAASGVPPALAGAVLTPVAALAATVAPMELAGGAEARAAAARRAAALQRVWLLLELRGALAARTARLLGTPATAAVVAPHLPLLPDSLASGALLSLQRWHRQADAARAEADAAVAAAAMDKNGGLPTAATPRAAGAGSSRWGSMRATRAALGASVRALGWGKPSRGAPPTSTASSEAAGGAPSRGPGDYDSQAGDAEAGAADAADELTALPGALTPTRLTVRTDDRGEDGGGGDGDDAGGDASGGGTGLSAVSHDGGDDDYDGRDEARRVGAASFAAGVAASPPPPQPPTPAVASTPSVAAGTAGGGGPTSPSAPHEEEM
jgi:hypothetical protein